MARVRRRASVLLNNLPPSGSASSSWPLGKVVVADKICVKDICGVDVQSHQQALSLDESWVQQTLLQVDWRGPDEDMQIVK